MSSFSSDLHSHYAPAPQPIVAVPRSGIAAVRRIFGVAVMLGVVLAPASASAGIITTPFGPNGEGGTLNGQVFFFGSGGEVFELDAFLNIGGMDLNGATTGISAQLSTNALPIGLEYSHSSDLSPDGSDLTLRYRFTNNTGATLANVWFFSFVDAEIDVAINDYFNEAGFQLGTLGIGAGDIHADSWEIDEPGYVFGDIFGNILNGILDNTNAVPFGAPDDVSMALGFQLGDLFSGQTAAIDILLSDDGDTIGNFALQHFEPNTNSSDTLTLSGVAYVPEPNALTFGLVAILCVGIGRVGVLSWKKIMQSASWA